MLATELGTTLAPQPLVDRLTGNGITASISERDTTIAEGRLRPEPAPDPADVGGADRGPPRPPVPPPGPVAIRTSDDTVSVTVDLPDQRQVVLFGSRAELRATLSRLLLIEVTGSVAILLLGAALVPWIVRIALRPLDRMAAVASRIADGSTEERIRPSRTDTELGRMAGSFDDMVDSLEASRRSATDTAARVRTFVSDASHELRTPVSALHASAETLLRTDPPRHRRERLAVQMVREATRAAKLVDDLLAMARLDQEAPLRRQRFNLVAVVAQEVARTKELAPSIAVRLVAPEHVEVIGDPVQIGQVVANLTDNARHATPPGREIVLTVRSEDTTATVEVADTGPGIPVADGERVFERFVRLDAARSRHAFGSGLGLAIARGITHAHGGTLRVADAPRGARLILEIPMVTPGD